MVKKMGDETINGVPVREAVKKFEREHPHGLWGKMRKGLREAGEKRAVERREEHVAYREAFRKARLRRAEHEGSIAGSRRWSDQFQNIGMNLPKSQSQIRYVNRPSGSHKKKSKKHHKQKSGGRDPFRFDIADNWGFFK
jgi:hypothetical protein